MFKENVLSGLSSATTNFQDSLDQNSARSLSRSQIPLSLNKMTKFENPTYHKYRKKCLCITSGHLQFNENDKNGAICMGSYKYKNSKVDHVLS